MKAIGVVGSPRKGGNTEILTDHALKAMAAEGIETEMVGLWGLDIRPCNACMACRQGEERCSIQDDLFPLYLRMKAADAIVLATPVYFGSATAQMKALMDRAGYIGRPQQVFAGKVGGPLVVARRGGHNFTLAQMAFWFHVLGFFMAGSSYWNIAFGAEKGDVRSDAEGLATAWQFGKNLALLLKKLNA